MNKDIKPTWAAAVLVVIALLAGAQSKPTPNPTPQPPAPEPPPEPQVIIQRDQSVLDELVQLRDAIAQAQSRNTELEQQLADLSAQLADQTAQTPDTDALPPPQTPETPDVAKHLVHIQTPVWAGTGVYIGHTARGYTFATARHVLQPRGWIRIKTDDKTLYGDHYIRLPGDPPDLALVFSQTDPEIEPAKLGTINNGDRATSAGYGGSSITSGGVFGGGRDFLIDEDQEPNISGDSGGGVFNSDGELVGIVSGHDAARGGRDCKFNSVSPYRQYVPELFEQLVQTIGDFKLLDFGASWCGPCWTMAPRVEQLKQEGVDVEYVDVDERRDLQRQYNVNSIPTFVLVDGEGNEVKRLVGAVSLQRLRQFVGSGR